MALDYRLLRQMERLRTGNPNTWVREGDMDADELINDYLAQKIDRTKHEAVDWQAYTDPFTGRQVWYDQELDWDTIWWQRRSFDIFENRRSEAMKSHKAVRRSRPYKGG